MAEVLVVLVVLVLLVLFWSSPFFPLCHSLSVRETMDVAIFLFLIGEFEFRFRRRDVCFSSPNLCGGFSCSSFFSLFVELLFSSYRYGSFCSIEG